MSWGRMDDKFHRNRKVRALRRVKGGREALGVWVFWWSWCLDGADFDGVVPSFELDPGEEKSANLLVEHGLWDRVDGGYAFHDFHAYNPTKDQVASKREADRVRVAGKRAASREDVARDSLATPTRVASTRVPSQPIPTQESATHSSPIPLDARISHSDAQETFGRLRQAHGGGPFRASQREYTRVSELADFANSQGSTREARVAALEATIRGYLAHADTWCTERGFPITGMHDFGVCLARGVTVAPKAPVREPSTPREKLVAERDKLRPLRNGQRLCSQEESDRIDRRWAEVEDAIDAIDGVTR